MWRLESPNLNCVSRSHLVRFWWPITISRDAQLRRCAGLNKFLRNRLVSSSINHQQFSWLPCSLLASRTRKNVLYNSYRVVWRFSGHVVNKVSCDRYGSSERLRLPATSNFDEERRSLGLLKRTNAPRLAPSLPAHACGFRRLHCLAHVPPPCLPMAYWQPAVRDPPPGAVPPPEGPHHESHDKALL